MAFSTDISILVIPCAPGCSGVLSRELADLGFAVTWTGETAVETEGTLDDCMRLNLHVRTGHRVLYMVGGFSARNPDELYAKTLDVPWEDYLDADGYFSVDVSVDTPTIRNDMFAALKVKDAVCDRFREVAGHRPDSGNEDRGAKIFLHWSGRDAALYLDTTGPALSRRGYRVESSAAPMRESLAAAVILSSKWDGDGNFVNPMCGGGTLAIEAALIASRRPPAMLRGDFAFMSLRGYDPAAWRALRTQALASIRREIPGEIICSDIDSAAIAAAQANAAEASVDDLIRFEVCDFAATPVPEKPLPNSVAILNPPYGDRMGEALKLRKTYRAIGDFCLAHAEDFTGYVFTASAELADQITLRRSREIPFFAGAKEARLLELAPEVDPDRRPGYAAFRDDSDDAGLAGV